MLTFGNKVGWILLIFINIIIINTENYKKEGNFKGWKLKCPHYK